ncbi:MAG: sulfatase-like hydrolase/transferase [Acidobacteriota bacterium]|nr:sulfatase-like hydrolase/transferase [Acidobacteriota bacterium]
MSRLVYSVLAALICQTIYAQTSTPVILISVDTLRADHLSSYQAGRRPTPHIDALAKNGTLFSQVSSPFPLTLPAHAALLTSTYPLANGVEDNGIPLPTSAVTLAAVLKKAGYHTAAFVGSFVLDRRFGLNQGFDVYDGPVDLHNKAATVPLERKRQGAQVTEAATRWLERNSNTPFFLFLHLYDLHLPYDLPQDPGLRRGETGYTAELAYEDRVLGEFFAFLDRRKLLQKALIVFTSDHGEGLGEHGESTHGYFIYQSTLHVPLIMHWQSGFKRAPRERVDEAASLLDVAPTILDAIGLPRPAAMRGRSLIGDAGGVSEIYSESLYARNHFGCAAVRSMRAGRYKYIESPTPELYDLSSDPSEQRNLYDQQRSRATALGEQMAAVRRSSPPRSDQPPSPKPDTIAALRSLGYLSGSTAAKHVESRVDPKDRIQDFERYVGALGLSSEGKVVEARGLLRRLSDKLPDVVDIRISLGLNQQQLGDSAQAAREFKRAIAQAPLDAQPHFELGSCYFRMGQLDSAIQEFKAALAIEPWYTRADEALAEIYIQKRDFPQARACLNYLLSVDPNNYTGHYNLGILAAMEEHWSEAEQRMQSALRADPGSAEAHDTLGGIYFQRGQLELARRQLEESIRLQPKLAAAHYKLALVFQKQGKAEAAAEQLRAAQAAAGGR